MLKLKTELQSNGKTLAVLQMKLDHCHLHKNQITKNHQEFKRFPVMQIQGLTCT